MPRTSTITLRSSPHRLVALLGPAFVAAIAYVDPGNVAANVSAGAEYGYLLLWVLVLANCMAAIVQYLSAKLGIVTGKSLPALLGKRFSPWNRRLYWLQAELVAAATDLAEVIGGALALYILFGIPLLPGGVIVGVLSILILMLQGKRQRQFEGVMIFMLIVITVGFVGGLLFVNINPAELVAGLVPRFADVQSLLLATSMLGATIMPHAIYLHSSLSRDRHGASIKASGSDPHLIKRLLRASKVDVFLALVLAGGVNIAMLVLAAASLQGVDGTDSIDGAANVISSHLGAGVGIVFGIGLLASGLASTSVGAYAGAEIMAGLLRVRIPLLVRRVVTLLPALVVLGAGIDPTWSLIISQVVLSFGLPFAIIPLVALTGKTELMGKFVNRLPLRIAGIAIAGAIVVLNGALIVLELGGIA